MDDPTYPSIMDCASIFIETTNRNTREVIAVHTTRGGGSGSEDQRESVHQTLRYMAVAQSITIRDLFFQPDRYKCSKCGQLKFEHWCPALALAAQERSTEDMICDMSRVVPLASLVIDHRLLQLSAQLSVPEEGADEGGEVQVAVGPCPMGGTCTLGLNCRYSDQSQPPSAGGPLPDLDLVFPATTDRLETPAPLPAPRPPLAPPSAAGPQMQMLQHLLLQQISAKVAFFNGLIAPSPTGWPCSLS